MIVHCSAILPNNLTLKDVRNLLHSISERTGNHVEIMAENTYINEEYTLVEWEMYREDFEKFNDIVNFVSKEILNEADEFEIKFYYADKEIIRKRWD